MIVLIADAAAENSELLCRLVQLQGHEPITASNGLEAVEQTRLHHPDFIFIDADLLVMSGDEAVTLIRKDARFADTPIVAFAADAQSADFDACRVAGCTDVVAKPLDFSRVQQLLIQHAELLDEARAVSESSNG